MIDPDNLTQYLQHRLSLSLPGKSAQRRMAPALSYGRHFGPSPSNAKQAAVMVLLYPHQNEWCLPLTLRPLNMPDHAGQVCLPGGRIELEESVREAAFRELQEELGVEQIASVLLGELSPLYIYASHHFVSPVVAVTNSRPPFIPSANEVAGFIEWPVSKLHFEHNAAYVNIQRHNTHWKCPCWKWESTEVWGATAMILAELAEILRGINQ